MKAYIERTLLTLLNTPSPTGYSQLIRPKLIDCLTALGYAHSTSNKGNVLVDIDGASDYAIGLTAHVDTLGAMVRAIDANGHLAFTRIGGYAANSIEGEYVTIHTKSGPTFTGTVLLKQPSVHTTRDVYKQERDEKTMYIRLDADVESKKDTEALGIQVGDFVSLDARAVITDSGYIKSRHLDDKAGAVAVLALLKHLRDNAITLPCALKIVFSTYEEVGHGAAAIPWPLQEIIAVDMGAMGDELTCTERQVSICAKDSSGPYDYGMVSTLIGLAQQKNIPHAVDIYPHYGSDVSASLRAGHDFRGALIGPGVHASHHMERTHIDGINATVDLLVAYLTTRGQTMR